MFYIKEQFHLQRMTQIESLVMVIELIGTKIITLFIVSLLDTFGTRNMLIISSSIYFLSSVLMISIQIIYMIFFMRLMSEFGIGLTMIIVPLYISDISPTCKKKFIVDDP